jgi:hypothetical protein
MARSNRRPTSPGPIVILYALLLLVGNGVVVDESFAGVLFDALGVDCLGDERCLFDGDIVVNSKVGDTIIRFKMNSDVYPIDDMLG